MPFLKRLGFFLVGLSIGLVFLAVFLKNKAEQTGTEFCYFPNCRVLKELRSKPLAYSPEVQAMLTAGRLDSLTITYFLREGDVQFSQSDTRASPCKIYRIEGEQQKTTRLMEVHNCRDSVRIYSLQ